MAQGTISQKDSIPQNIEATPPPQLMAAGDPVSSKNSVTAASMDLKNPHYLGLDKGNSYKNDNFAREKQRRAQLNGNYQVLRTLIPNVTKVDRASVVKGAIEYIRELIKTLNDLKLLVKKKKRAVREWSKTAPWMQRKSKDIEVDVQIRDDEVTIKLVQKKKINCLLFVSKVLHELHLDLRHLEGGLAGDYCCVFLFKTKVCGGSSIDASAIANKVIEVLDHPAAVSHTTS